MSDLFGNEEKLMKPFTTEENRDFKVKTFKEVKAYLIEIGQYHSIDDSLMKVYASSICDIRKYNAILEIEGDIVLGIKGRKEQHPLVLMRNKSIDTATKLASSLGILSLNRKKLDSSNTGNDEDDFAEFD